MRKKILLVFSIAAALLCSACGGKDEGESEKTTEQQTTQETVQETSSEQNEDDKETVMPKKMTEQGNPLTISLAEIAEEGDDDTLIAWIKIATAFDPDLSMFKSDLIPEGTKGVVVDFTVSGMDIDSTEMYWCYQIGSNSEIVSLWDDSSPTDKLLVDGDGSYRFVFDAEKALGGTMDETQSLQMVFPGISDTTTTKVTVDFAGYVDDSLEIGDFVTGKLE